MKSSVKDWGPRPFKTIDAWFMEPGFKDFVKEKWCSYNVPGNSIYRLKEKLKLLKVDLKEWNRNEYGCLETKKKQILRHIEDLDVIDDNNSLEEHDKLRRMELFSHLRLIDKQVESLCRQKSRANWFKLGDSNSKFFHSAIRWRRLKNEVKGVEIDHQWCEEPKVIRREAKNTFNQRFLATHDVEVNLGFVEFKTLPVEDVLSLVIDESQSAFLKDRGMLDSVLMANEVVEEITRKQRSGICLKVDYEKAYDSVRWKFLFDMLQRLGFHSKWIAWVRGCLESSSVSVLVNGSPTEEFKPSRGLR
ncbi:uncharacterized protein [Phaseolus vulgaris]|uniref:uncharacterized protein n=1 Tax=Phaseolus vulgaris TaxID=3885 RepID=UPI0035CA8224